MNFLYHFPRFWYHFSFVEAAFARGDRRIGEVLLRAWQLGCRFDGWTEYFHMDLWMRAFAEAGLDPAFYANRERGEEEIFPWEHIDAGVTKEFLLREWHKALKAETTQDCRKGCVNCGIRRYKGACV